MLNEGNVNTVSACCFIGKRQEELYVWVSDCVNGEHGTSQLKLKRGKFG